MYKWVRRKDRIGIQVYSGSTVHGRCTFGAHLVHTLCSWCIVTVGRRGPFEGCREDVLRRERKRVCRWMIALW